MNAAEKSFAEQVQERVREKFNPGWRQQLAMHREALRGRPGESAVQTMMRKKREAWAEVQRKKKL